jgi:hypothetical protein
MNEQIYKSKDENSGHKTQKSGYLSTKYPLY